jgi:hypothetical protein
MEIEEYIYKLNEQDFSTLWGGTFIKRCDQNYWIRHLPVRSQLSFAQSDILPFLAHTIWTIPPASPGQLSIARRDFWSIQANEMKQEENSFWISHLVQDSVSIAICMARRKIFEGKIVSYLSEIRSLNLINYGRLACRYARHNQFGFVFLHIYFDKPKRRDRRLSI